MGVRELWLKYLRAHPENVIYADQDLLNATLHHLCAHLPTIWNVTGELFRSPPSPTALETSDIDVSALLADPAIVDFNG